MRLKLIASMLCSVFWLSGTGYGEEAVDPYKTLMDAALAKLDARDLDGAEKAYQAVLALKPDDPAAKGGLIVVQQMKYKSASKPVYSPAPVETLPPPAPAPVVSNPPPAPAPAPIKPVESVKTAEPVKTVELMEFPEMKKLNRDDWDKGPGSGCYWAGDRLHLNEQPDTEGDEKYKLPLRGNFAAQVQVEAVTGQFGLLYVDLRPDNKKLPQVRGYAYREMEAPSLLVGKKAVARGGKMLEAEQITLGFRRTGKQIEYFCNGDKVGETWDIPEDAVLWLWVCGKGTVDRFGVDKK